MRATGMVLAAISDTTVRLIRRARLGCRSYRSLRGSVELLRGLMDLIEERKEAARHRLQDWPQPDEEWLGGHHAGEQTWRRMFSSSSALPAPITTELSGSSARNTGRPVSSRRSASRPFKSAPPPASTMPRSATSPASSGGGALERAFHRLDDGVDRLGERVAGSAVTKFNSVPGALPPLSLRRPPGRARLYHREEAGEGDPGASGPADHGASHRARADRRRRRRRPWQDDVSELQQTLR